MIDKWFIYINFFRGKACTFINENTNFKVTKAPEYRI